VKISRAKSGPYRDRLHYTVTEIETLTEDELRKHELLPTKPRPINIDLYVEQRFVTPRYDTLSPTLLGYTEFGASGPIDIVINEALASDKSTVAKRRVRTTIAHEGGHALLHTILHLDTGQTSLLASNPEERRVMCKEEDLQRNSYDGKWWEYQANLAMSSLLLPKNLTMTALDPFLTTTVMGGRTIDPHNITRAASAISEIFDVNPVVAKIRIQQFFSH
jgi:hypothetical protein